MSFSFFKVVCILGGKILYFQNKMFSFRTKTLFTDLQVYWFSIFFCLSSISCLSLSSCPRMQLGIKHNIYSVMVTYWTSDQEIFPKLVFLFYSLHVSRKFHNHLIQNFFYFSLSAISHGWIWSIQFFQVKDKLYPAVDSILVYLTPPFSSVYPFI